MARRIIWTSRAEIIFAGILEFYYKRNGNKTYSKKIYQEVNHILSFLKNNPFIGRETNTEKIRVVIKGNFKIFYQIEPTKIVVLLVWDCRQNPADLKI